MKRPLLLRYGPVRVRQSLWSRLYRPTPARLLPLYDDAPLHFAPQVKMRVVPGDWVSDSIAMTGVYELPLTRWLLSLARGKGGVLVDVGANLGYFSLLWASQRPDNRVVAFEASPRNIPLLHENAARNSLSDRIEIHGKAVGKEPGSLQFDLGPEDQRGWGGFAHAGSAVGDTVSVDVVRLDEVLAASPKIALLKIDVEGADPWVLRGAERLLVQRRIENVCWEQNLYRMNQLGIGQDDAPDFLRSVGYEPRVLEGEGDDCQLWHARPN